MFDALQIVRRQKLFKDSRRTGVFIGYRKVQKVRRVEGKAAIDYESDTLTTGPYTHSQVHMENGIWNEQEQDGLEGNVKAKW